MQKIVPHLWFDKEAKEATQFYVDTFGGDSKVTHVTTLHDTPSGDADTVAFRLLGHDFMAISAGPYFKFNPSISFMVALETAEEVDRVWEKLSDGGFVMMELGEYPFSERYGWVADKYGLSWQIGVMKQKLKQAVTPTLMFVQDVVGKAEEAMNFYVSLFDNSSVDFVMRWEEGEGPDKAGTIKHAQFTLTGQSFSAMDSAQNHKFNFNEAVSLMVYCKDQKEIDYFWEKLSAVPEAEQCGWLKDRYGVSWQIVPMDMDKMMASDDKAAVARVTKAFLKMKKFDLVELHKAFEGK